MGSSPARCAAMIPFTTLRISPPRVISVYLSALHGVEADVDAVQSGFG